MRRTVALAQDIGEHRQPWPDVDLRMQQAADAFDVEQSLLQQDQLQLQR